MSVQSHPNVNVECQRTSTHSAIVTKPLPVRTSNRGVPWLGQDDYGLGPRQYTLGELFSDAGDATAAVGKWTEVEHLGGRSAVTQIRTGRVTAEAPEHGGSPRASAQPRRPPIRSPNGDQVVLVTRGEHHE